MHMGSEHSLSYEIVKSELPDGTTERQMRQVNIALRFYFWIPHNTAIVQQNFLLFNLTAIRAKW